MVRFIIKIRIYDFEYHAKYLMLVDDLFSIRILRSLQ